MRDTIYDTFGDIFFHDAHFTDVQHIKSTLFVQQKTFHKCTETIWGTYVLRYD